MPQFTARGVIGGLIGLFTLFMAVRLFESLGSNGTGISWLVIFGIWFVGFTILSLVYLMVRPSG